MPVDEGGDVAREWPGAALGDTEPGDDEVDDLVIAQRWGYSTRSAWA